MRVFCSTALRSLIPDRSQPKHVHMQVVDERNLGRNKPLKIICAVTLKEYEQILKRGRTSTEYVGSPFNMQTDHIGRKELRVAIWRGLHLTVSDWRRTTPQIKTYHSLGNYCVEFLRVQSFRVIKNIFVGSWQPKKIKRTKCLLKANIRTFIFCGRLPHLFLLRTPDASRIDSSNEGLMKNLQYWRKLHRCKQTELKMKQTD